MKHILPTLITSAFIMLASVCISQSYVHQVLVLNEGYFDYSTSTIETPVTVGSYDPSTHVYQTVSTINGARFASDLVIHDGFYYVAADAKIIKFDLNSHQPVAEANCLGVRNIAIYNNMLIATRGEYLVNLDSHLQLFNTEDLSLILSFDTTNGPQYPTQNIVVHNGIAYIAINNAYDFGNEVGKIGQLNLNTLQYGNEIDLGTEGKNPDNMMLFGDEIITVNNLDWTGASISRISTIDNTWENHPISYATSGCGTSALNEEKIMFQISMDTVLKTLDLNTMVEADAAGAPQIPYYEIAKETISGMIYASETDYFSFGKVYILDDQYHITETFETGVSPGTIAFDIRSALSIQENEQSQLVYPNPANEIITIGKPSTDTFTLFNLLGEIVCSGQCGRVDISHLQSGNYIVQVNNHRESLIIIE